MDEAAEELAPEGCVVCGKPLSAQLSGWVYLAGSTPRGAMCCSPACTQIAVKRFYNTGRVDEQ